MPILAATLFSVHPVKVEAIANVTHGCEVFSLFFQLCALFVYLKREFTWVGTVGTKCWYDFLLIFGLVAVAMMFKETGVCILVFILWLMVYWGGGEGAVECSSVAILLSTLIVTRFTVTGGTSISFDDQFNSLTTKSKLSANWFKLVTSIHLDVLKRLFLPSSVDLTIDPVINYDDDFAGEIMPFAYLLLGVAFVVSPDFIMAGVRRRSLPSERRKTTSIIATPLPSASRWSLSVLFMFS